jgi:hypothetical protein
VRVLSPVVLGLWLGGLAASWVAASTSFRTVDRVLGESARPELLEKLKTLGLDERRAALRHLASEINRAIFVRWAPAQLAIGALLLALLWREAGAVRALAAASLALVVVQIACVAPIVDLGRSIDFVPRPLPPDVARRFGLLHGGYVLADLAKTLLLAAEAWALGRS